MLIEWSDIIERCDITGVIHVGAYTGEERKYYRDIPTKWVEADPDLIPHLQRKGLNVYHFAATDYVGTGMLNICPFKPANSLLEPNLNKRRTDVRVIDTVEVPTNTIESIQEQGYNFLSLDIQGGEMKALQGCDLSQIDGILCEIHKVETYVNVPQVEDIDYLLQDFERVLTHWTKYGWGDALYIRK